MIDEATLPEWYSTVDDNELEAIVDLSSMKLGVFHVLDASQHHRARADAATARMYAEQETKAGSDKHLKATEEALYLSMRAYCGPDGTMEGCPGRSASEDEWRTWYRDLPSRAVDRLWRAIHIFKNEHKPLQTSETEGN